MTYRTESCRCKHPLPVPTASQPLALAQSLLWYFVLPLSPGLSLESTGHLRGVNYTSEPRAHHEWGYFGSPIPVSQPTCRKPEVAIKETDKVTDHRLL